MPLKEWTQLDAGNTKELSAFGHQIVMRGDYSSTRMGSGRAVQRNVAARVNPGASDPRMDGVGVHEWLRVGRRP
jgi:gamma-glutamyltranspeptidase